ncbi:G patch domain and ankyrin repeat-containing protein 1-like [Mya arenaria]|uniref:G patch domain and ankyrin repeat-containing protein 1-like n=1 Tax=Mya arenaria TaxID=6604 RepID=UPI0022E2CBE8|nr:G patch domain and ankyrin repeat-containing protein 1-like [Mya arenaria]
MSAEYRHLINFIPAASTPEPVREPSTSGQGEKQLDGEEIRAFYEDVVKSDFHCEPVKEKERPLQNGTAQNHRSENKTKKHRREAQETRTVVKEEAEYVELGIHQRHASKLKKESLKKFPEPLEDCGKDLHKIHHKLLTLSQNGDISALEKLLGDGHVDVNFQDQYGWTAVMCAGVAGHFKAVQFLLSVGASRYVINSQNKTVDDLCPNLLRELEKLEREKPKKSKKRRSSFFCDICGCEFSDSTPVEHNSSTLHLFNIGRKPKTDHFMLQKNNIGFQLMEKSGWDGQSGLGSKGQGQKYPVKTSLKRDRKCLGGDDKKSKTKVTHFGPNDASAVKSLKRPQERVMSAATVSKRERKRKIKKDKNWERDLRTYMNMPD